MKYFFLILFTLTFIGCKNSPQHVPYTLKQGEAEYVKKLNNISDTNDKVIDECIKKAIDNEWYSLIDKIIDLGLIEKKMNRKNSYYMNPLEYAVIKRKPDIVKVLLNAGADINKGLEPPLAHAVFSDNFEMVKLLVQAGARVNKETPESEYAIVFASKSIKIAQYLLEHGANPNETGWEGLTALHETESVEMAQLFVKYGAKIIPDKYGQIPLHQAAIRLNEPLVNYLIELGADVNTLDIFSETPLFRFYDAFAATKSQHIFPSVGNVINIHKTLLEKTQDINMINSDGQSVLHLISSGFSRYDFTFINDLIRKGVNVNLQDNKGKTPAHYSAEIGNLRILNELVKAGADLTIKDSNGNMPLDVLKVKYSFLN